MKYTRVLSPVCKSMLCLSRNHGRSLDALSLARQVRRIRPLKQYRHRMSCDYTYKLTPASNLRVLERSLQSTAVEVKDRCPLSSLKGQMWS